MKKTYIRPGIGVEELKMESVLQANSKKVTNTAGNAGIGYRGGGNGPARAGENHLWDEEDDDNDWDQL